MRGQVKRMSERSAEASQILLLAPLTFRRSEHRSYLAAAAAGMHWSM